MEGQDWEKTRITAAQCPRISAEFLAEEHRTMGEWWIRQEYNCEFVDTVDSVFRYEDIQAALDNDLKPFWPVDDDFTAVMRRQNGART
jgi:hypothetical protein